MSARQGYCVIKILGSTREWRKEKRHFVITYGMVRSAKNDLTGKIRKTLYIGNSISTSYFVSKQEIHRYPVSSSRLIMNFIFSLWNKFGIRECFISTFKANRPFTVGQSCGQNFRAGEQKRALGQETNKGNNHLEKCKLLFCLVPSHFLLLRLAFIVNTWLLLLTSQTKLNSG